MAISEYLGRLRAVVGHDLLLVPSAAAVVHDDAGRILLEQRSDTGTWALPAGGIDPGEQPAAAALREIEEETGVLAEIERLAGLAMHPAEYPNGDRCEYLNVWFRCRAIGGDPRRDEDETLDVRWFEPDALPDIHPFTRLRIDTALREGPPWFVPPGEALDTVRLRYP
ncbi:NUDIX domain-containing protein [Actinocatenispora sera]|uniref:NUDIX hydrolase n=1 Tax=Actinocatenispora sera TaxID=390989 RepID=UPI00341189A7